MEIEKSAPKKVKPTVIEVPATALRHKEVAWCAHGINQKYCPACKDKVIKKKTEPAAIK